MLGGQTAGLFMAGVYSDGSGPRPGQLLDILNNPPGLSILAFGVRQNWAGIQAVYPDVLGEAQRGRQEGGGEARRCNEMEWVGASGERIEGGG